MEDMDETGVVVIAHQGNFLMRPLLRQGEQWFLEPVRPEEPAIPLDLGAFDRSGLIWRGGA